MISSIAKLKTKILVLSFAVMCVCTIGILISSAKKGGEMVMDRPSDRIRQAEKELAQRLSQVEQYRCWGDSIIHQCLKALARHPGHRLAMKQLDKRLAEIKCEVAADPSLRLAFPPPPGVFDRGELFLGFTSDDQVYALDLDRLVRIVGVPAPLGSGKTNILARLVSGTAMCGVERILVVAIKPELVGLRYLRDPPLDLVCMSRDLRWGLFAAPPGVRKMAYAESVLQILSWHLSIEYAQDILLECIRDLYERFDKLKGEPSIEHLLRRLDQYKPRSFSEQKYLQTAKSALGRFYKYTFPLFDCSGGGFPEVLKRRSLILASDLPSPAIYQIFCSLAFNYVFQEKLAKGKGDAVLDQLLVFDDAQQLIVSQRPSGSQSPITPFYDLAQKARATGIGIVLGFHTPSLIGAALTSQMQTLLCPGAFSSFDEILVLGKAMGLSALEMPSLQRGTIGSAVCSQSGTAYPYPVKIKVAEMVFDRSVPTEKWHRDMAPILSSLRWFPLVKSGEYEPNNPQRPDALSDEAFRLLLAVVLEPDRNASWYRTKLGASSYRLQKAKADLVSKGFLREHSVASQKYFEITDAGYVYARVDPPKRRGRGDFVHGLIVRRVASCQEKVGCHILGVEWRLPDSAGKVTDLAFRESGSEGRLVAVEVAASGQSDEVGNIVRCLTSGGADTVWSVAASQQISRRIRRELVRQGHGPLISKGQVEFRLASEFLI